MRRSLSVGRLLTCRSRTSSRGGALQRRWLGVTVTAPIVPDASGPAPQRRPTTTPSRSLLHGAFREFIITSGMWTGIYGGGSIVFVGGMSYMGLLPPAGAVVVASSLWGLGLGVARGAINAGRHLILESGALSASMDHANLLMYGQANDHTKAAGMEESDNSGLRTTDIAYSIHRIYESLPWIPRKDGLLRNVGLWLTYQTLPHVEHVVIEVGRELKKTRFAHLGTHQMQAVIAGTCHGLIVSAAERVKELLLLGHLCGYVLFGGILLVVLWTKEKSRAAAVAVRDTAEQALRSVSVKVIDASEKAMETLAHARDKTSEQYEVGKELARESVTSARKKISDMSETTQQMATDGSEVARKTFLITKEVASDSLESIRPWLPSAKWKEHREPDSTSGAPNVELGPIEDTVDK